ncbi:MAG: AbrB/MazE/SpoVT family DNA-binding domain-containing protein [Gemmatimonadaceae bacterium]
MTVRAVVEQNGRILLPAAIRKQLGIVPGDELVLHVEGDELRVASMEAAVRKVQKAVRRQLKPVKDDVSLADDVIAMRRKDIRRG